ncbi:MAG: DUF4925 domain-containing protein [Pseudoflavonifractor sp.]|nr:DUF4925 domain-containing protein [Pseudoflavonifractor sp.]
MKRYIGFILFMLTICGVVSSCSDKEDEPVRQDYLSGSYTDDPSLWMLKLTVNGRSVSGKTVKIVSQDYKGGYMMLYDIVPGSSKCKIPISIVYDQDKDCYEFDGVYRGDDVKTPVKYDGEISFPNGMVSTAYLDLDIEY